MFIPQTYSDKFVLNFTLQSSNEDLKVDKNATLEKMRVGAIKDSRCGQNALVERKTVLVPRSEITVYAIVTNVKAFDCHLSNGDVKPRRESITRKRSNGRKRKMRS